MDFSTVVVAENLPKVPAAKFEKLKAFIINKAFNKAGSIVHDKLVVPQNKDGSTKGIAIIEYEDRDAVTKAIAFNKNKIRFTASCGLPRVARISSLRRLRSISRISTHATRVTISCALGFRTRKYAISTRFGTQRRRKFSGVDVTLRSSSSMGQRSKRPIT